AFVAATEALTHWETDDLEKQVQENAKYISKFTNYIVKKYPQLKAEAKGRGLMQGVACHVDGIAGKICEKSFERGLLMETSGPNDEVFKFLPPLIIDKEGLKEGFNIIEESIKELLK